MTFRPSAWLALVPALVPSAAPPRAAAAASALATPSASASAAFPEKVHRVEKLSDHAYANLVVRDAHRRRAAPGPTADVNAASPGGR